MPNPFEKMPMPGQKKVDEAASRERTPDELRAMGTKPEELKTESAVEEEKRKRKEELGKLYWELRKIPDNREFEARYITAERAMMDVYNRAAEQLGESRFASISSRDDGSVVVLEVVSEEEAHEMRKKGETVYGENYRLKRELSPDRVDEETKKLMKEYERLEEEFETFVHASVDRRG